jgi:hypothetical protein
LKKILVKIQGKTLILPYRIRPAPPGGSAYITVPPSDELARFNLKGLTPEMFCVNIADMVNIRRQFSGTVENEQQAAVARWEMNEEEYRLATSFVTVKPTHRQIVELLAELPGYIQESDGQFIDFEESVIAFEKTGEPLFSGYRLTIVTEDIGDRIAPYAYYVLDTRTTAGWRDIPPPEAHHEALRAALAKLLQAIAAAGVMLSEVYDQTDYVLAG